MLLLRQESVQQDLKIGKKEAATIKEFTNEQHKKALKVDKLAESEKDSKYDQMAKENEDFLKKTLTSTQNERLRQIAMQRAGLLWLTQPEVVAKLKLTDKQQQQAKSEQLKARDETDKALSASSAKERDKKLNELKETSHERMMKLLNADQQSKWKELVGAPFNGEFVFEVNVSEK